MKISSCPDCHRREFLRRTVLGSAALFTVSGAFAEALTITPPMTEGPFYPDKLPLDTDNDLVVLMTQLHRELEPSLICMERSRT
jgi:protocatechuate 3,4-dioxygenase beta subunit